jgi:hypothetical protein
VLVGLGREPGDVCGFALEEVGDEDAVFLRRRGGEDVGALQGLGEEAEDVWPLLSVCENVFQSVKVGLFALGSYERREEEEEEEICTVDDEDGLCCVGGAGDVWFCSC